MARIKLGAIVVGMSGKLGGHVFANNRAGAYMRTKTSPTNPRTAYQTAVRAMFAGITSIWGTLTDAQRQSFDDAVQSFSRTDVFGDSKNPTGKALFQRLNQNLVNTGQAQITLAPAPAAVANAAITGAAGATAVQALTVTTGNDLTGSKVLIYATPALTPGTSFIKNKLRQISAVSGAAAGPIDILAAYTAKFGAVSEGANISIGVRVVNTVGMASPMQTVKAVIAA